MSRYHYSLFYIHTLINNRCIPSVATHKSKITSWGCWHHGILKQRRKNLIVKMPICKQYNGRSWNRARLDSALSCSCGGQVRATQSWKLREMSQYSLPLAKRTCVSVRLCCLQTLEIKRIGREDTSPISTRVNKFDRWPGKQAIICNFHPIYVYR